MSLTSCGSTLMISFFQLTCGLCFILIVHSMESSFNGFQAVGDKLVVEIASKTAAILRRNLLLPGGTDENLQEVVLEELEPEFKHLQSLLNTLTPSEIARLQRRFNDEILSLTGFQESKLSPRFPFLALGMTALSAVVEAVIEKAATVFE